MPPNRHHRQRPIIPKNRRWLVWIVLALVGVGATIYRDTTRQPSGNAPASGSIAGRATAGDGDSLRIQSTRVRLVDIDALELDQCCRDRTGALIRCGEVSRAHLRRLIGGREVSCTWREADPNGRALATCTAVGENLNARMVEDGFAIQYYRRSRGGWQPSPVYRAEAERARAASRGLHSYREMEPPHVLRANRRNGAPPRISGC
ncbi:MAG: hypothetical protein RLZ98_1095 [Pseudomonadota bacterium]|jgi:endonuclease YncB( thermonuclease family)